MTWYTNVERQGNFILCRGYEANGKPFFWKEEYKPRIFLPSPNSETNPKYMSLDDKPLSEFYPGTIDETRKFLDSFKDVANFDYFGMENPVYNYIADKFKSKVTYDQSKLNIGFFDIETESHNGFPDIEKTEEEVLIVSFHIKNKFHFFSSEKYGVYKPHLDNIEAHSFKTEKEMLIAVINFWVSQKFDIISGWNSEYFDIPYLVNRIKKVLGFEWVKKLSPWGIVRPKDVQTKHGDIKSYNIVGVNHIDYLDTFKKFADDQVDNYKLDTVGREVLGVAKLDYSEYGALHLLYQQNFQLYGEYNIRDNEILALLEKKKKLFDMIVSLALNAKVNFIDVFKQTVLWDSIFYNHLLEKNIIIPKKERHHFTGKIPGGFVKESRPDFYKWVMSFDLDSLYPHLIMGQNISPETFVEVIDVDIEDLVLGMDCDAIRHAKAMNYALCANGSLFRKDKRGFIPEIMDVMYEERKEFKRLMLEKKGWLKANEANLTPDEISETEDEINKLNVYQNVRKVCLNSAYGSLAQIGFRFFKPELASAITMAGQLAIRWADRHFNEMLQKAFGDKDDYVLAADTDSAHVSFDKLVQKFQEKKPGAPISDIVEFLDGFAKKTCQPFIAAFYEKLAVYVNSYEQKMKMKREYIVESGVYLAKKKYIYNVHDAEGVRYKSPVIEVKGVELVRSNTPYFCRDKMMEVCKIVLRKTEADLIDYVAGVKKEFFGLTFDQVAQPTGVNGVSQYTDRTGNYIKGTPIHVRASILYNQMLKKKNIEKDHEKIKDGDKIKFCYLKLPNPTFENVIGTLYEMPKEFGIDEYIDYDAQFEKTFLAATKRICDARGWDIEKQDTLDDFWS